MPALIGMLVHIAVIAGEIASAMDLEDELLQLHPGNDSGAAGWCVP